MSDDWAVESETVNMQVRYEVVGKFVYRLLWIYCLVWR